ncbi:DUF3231 family protein [Bacillus sp. 31A1R]|uniref:DUF3231 family protein n=1 Tax=Robertmurraya mangrovi TaxID=3098077 RepID=A0ABU5J0S3_9BACI|nr:DUF3231 family protein [Bacillus sp. 31A1R]MDZ5472967.1 DUF3231 family protein [Bacillus sp. 31A1R]
MDKEDIKFTSAEIGTLWGAYVNGTAIDTVNRYMVSIVENEKIKAVLEEAIQIFAQQKEQIVSFIKRDGFPLPNGFNDSDLRKDAKRLFTDIFCLHYIHIMTLHGLIGHVTALSSSVNKDLRHFYDSCDNDAKELYHKSTELLLELGHFQRDPYFYPEENQELIIDKDFTDGFFGNNRRIAATEIISLSLNLKKAILSKALSISFSQVSQIPEAKEFLEYSGKVADKQIQSLAAILQKDNLPAPMSWETEITNSTDSPFSDKLMMFHLGFLFQTAQTFQGAGLATAMRTDLAYEYEKIILTNLAITKKWFNIMVKYKWLEQPPLAPNRKNITRGK